jgi:DNA-directed RNA polymerase subunit D
MGLIPIKTPKVSGKEIMFKLKKDGPGIVYSGDLIPSVGTEDKLPISILDEEQKIELNAIARLGKGIEHIKYSPGLVFYKHDLENELLDFVKIDDSGKVSFNEEELKSKGLTEEKINKIRKLNKINEVLVTLESWGQIEVKELFLKAIEALNKNLDELSKTVK